MKFKLPTSIYAPEQIMAVRYELQAYSDWLANQSVRRKTGAKLAEEPALSDDTIDLMKLWQDGAAVSPQSATELANYLASLSLPVIHIMLAAPPNTSFRQELVKWFREVGANDYLVSISINRTIGGGAVIRTPNHYYDYTYGHLVLEHRDKLPQLVRQMAAEAKVEELAHV